MAIPHSFTQGLEISTSYFDEDGTRTDRDLEAVFLDIFTKVVAILFKQTFATMLLAWKARMQKILTNSPIWQDMAMNSENIIKLLFSCHRLSRTRRQRI